MRRCRCDLPVGCSDWLCPSLLHVSAQFAACHQRDMLHGGTNKKLCLHAAMCLILALQANMLMKPMPGRPCMPGIFADTLLQTCLNLRFLLWLDVSCNLQAERRSLQAAVRAFTGAPPREAGATDGTGAAGAGAALGSVPRVLALVADLEVCPADIAERVFCIQLCTHRLRGCGCMQVTLLRQGSCHALRGCKDAQHSGLCILADHARRDVILCKAGRTEASHAAWPYERTFLVLALVLTACCCKQKQ